MNCTASSYFTPLSMRAKATKTGALRRKKSSGAVEVGEENHRRREGEKKI